MEFCQWLKAFYDQSGVFREDYDPMAVRARGKGGKRYQYNRKGAATARPAAGRPRPTTTATRKAPAAKPAAPKPAAAAPADPPSPKGIRESRPLRERHNGKPVETKVDAALKKENEELQAKHTELEATNAELEANVGTLEEAVLEIEKERDFYFGKLRHVEVLLQIFQETEDADTTKVVDDIFKILYAVRTTGLACVVLMVSIRYALTLFSLLLFSDLDIIFHADETAVRRRQADSQ